MNIADYNQLQTKLSDIFEHATKSKDTMSFFTYLYNYAEVLDKYQPKEQIVSNTLGLYYGDGDPDFMKDIPDFTTALKTPSEEFNKEATKWLSTNLTNEKYQTEVYHCWLRIFLYYRIRKSSYDQKTQYKNWIQYKASNLLIKKEFTNIFKLNTDKGNHTFKTPIFRLSLELFHPALLVIHN